MSLYASIWKLKFPKHGDDHIGCDWIEVLDDSRTRKRMIAVVAFLLALSMAGGIGAAEQYTLGPEFKDVTINIQKLKSRKSGHWVVVWGRTVVWIIKRSQEEIRALEQADTSLLGAPQGEYWRSQFEKAFDSAPQLPNLLALDQLPLEHSPYRSLRKDIFVVMHASPYTGCVLSYRPMNTLHKFFFGWKGGFYDSCSGEIYDLSGRIFKNYLRKKFWNLYIPPHQYVDKDTLLIGLGNPPRTVSSTDYAPKIDYKSMKPVQRLIEAAKRGRIVLVKELLDDGLAVESVVGPGVTPLLVASAKGRNDVIQLLLERGASPNKPNNYGFTPLHSAIAGYQPKTVNLLASHGADVNRVCPTPDCNGTPINFAIYWTLQEEDAVTLVSILLKHGANPRISHEGKNAFDWAREKGYDKVLAILEPAKLKSK